jgi:hypothetical protein
MVGDDKRQSGRHSPAAQIWRHTGSGWPNAVRLHGPYGRSHLSARVVSLPAAPWPPGGRPTRASPPIGR